MKKRGKKEEAFTGSEVKRYMGVLAEEFQSRVSAIGEQFSGLNKKLDSHTDTLDSHTEMIADLAVRMTQIELNTAITKEDVEFIKSHLKQKVDQEEFSALVRRVSLLEKRAFGTKR